MGDDFNFLKNLPVGVFIGVDGDSFDNLDGEPENEEDLDDADDAVPDFADVFDAVPDFDADDAVPNADAELPEDDDADGRL